MFENSEEEKRVTVCLLFSDTTPRSDKVVCVQQFLRIQCDEYKHMKIQGEVKRLCCECERDHECNKQFCEEKRVTCLPFSNRTPRSDKAACI